MEEELIKQQERKLYNQNYYNDNKNNILRMHSSKVECPMCKKSLRRQYIPLHIGNKICKKNLKTKIMQDAVNNITIEHLKNIDIDKLIDDTINQPYVYDAWK